MIINTHEHDISSQGYWLLSKPISQDYTYSDQLWEFEDQSSRPQGYVLYTKMPLKD